MILQKTIRSQSLNNIQKRKIYFIAIITLQLLIPLDGFCDCSFCYSIAKTEITTSKGKFTGYIKVNEGYGDCDCGAYNSDSIRMYQGNTIKLYSILDSFNVSCPVWTNGSWVKDYNIPPIVFLSGEIISINTNSIISYKIINYPVSAGPYFSVSDYSKLKTKKIEAIFICDLLGSETSMTYIIKLTNNKMPEMKDLQKYNEASYSYKKELNKDALNEISKRYDVIIFETEYFD